MGNSIEDLEKSVLELNDDLNQFLIKLKSVLSPQLQDWDKVEGRVSDGNMSYNEIKINNMRNLVGRMSCKIKDATMRIKNA